MAADLGAAKARAKQARVKLTEKQHAVVSLVEEGVPLEAAMDRLGVAESTRGRWLYEKPFMEGVKAALEKHYRLPPDPGWGPEALVKFRADYMGNDTPKHQRVWVDHYFNCPKRFHLITTCPEAGKTTLLGIDIPAFRFAKERYEHAKALIAGEIPPDPVRIAHLAAEGTLAEDIGWQLRQALTTNEKLIADFGSFKPDDRAGGAWSARAAYMSWRTASQKEPSVQWAGIGANVQGKRLTDGHLDDIDTAQKTPSERRSMLRVLKRVIIQRLGTKGRLFFICNRQDEADVAATLLEDANTPGSSWCVIQQAAIVEGPNGEESFWPERFPLEYLQQLRLDLGDREFNLVYQQIPSSGIEAVFPSDLLDDAKRVHLDVHDALDASITVLGFDPAPDGAFAACLLSFSKDGKRVRVQDVAGAAGGGHEGNFNLLKQMLEKHHPDYLAFESQGQNALFLSEEVKKFCVAHTKKGTQGIVEVTTTGQGKHNLEWRISEIASWLRQGKFEFCWGEGARRGMGGLYDEMTMFRFDSDEHGKYRGKKDRLMALGFAFQVGLEKARLGGNILPFGRAARLAPWVESRQRSFTLNGNG